MEKNNDQNYEDPNWVGFCSVCGVAQREAVLCYPENGGRYWGSECCGGRLLENVSRKEGEYFDSLFDAKDFIIHQDEDTEFEWEIGSYEETVRCGKK